MQINNISSSQNYLRLKNHTVQQRKVFRENIQKNSPSFKGIEVTNTLKTYIENGIRKSKLLNKLEKEKDIARLNKLIKKLKKVGKASHTYWIQLGKSSKRYIEIGEQDFVKYNKSIKLLSLKDKELSYNISKNLKNLKKLKKEGLKGHEAFLVKILESLDPKNFLKIVNKLETLLSFKDKKLASKFFENLKKEGLKGHEAFLVKILGTLDQNNFLKIVNRLETLLSLKGKKLASNFLVKILETLNKTKFSEIVNNLNNDLKMPRIQAKISEIRTLRYLMMHDKMYRASRGID